MTPVASAASRDARRLAHRLIADCQTIAGIDRDRIKVEFTQHRGDEMYHPHLGGFNADWQPGAGEPDPQP
jgi:hypothetical protein